MSATRVGNTSGSGASLGVAGNRRANCGLSGHHA